MALNENFFPKRYTLTGGWDAIPIRNDISALVMQPLVTGATLGFESSPAVDEFFTLAAGSVTTHETALYGGGTIYVKGTLDAIFEIMEIKGVLR